MELVLNAITDGMRSNGAVVNRICLTEQNIKFCTGCKQCYAKGKCVHDDDVKGIVDEMYDCDYVIIGSPSYWGDVTAQMKVFIDRCTPYCNAKARKREVIKTKGIAVAIRAGQNKKENENLVHTIEHFLDHLDIELLSSFTVQGIDKPDDLKCRPQVLKDAFDFGRNIMA